MGPRRARGCFVYKKQSVRSMATYTPEAEREREREREKKKMNTGSEVAAPLEVYCTLPSEHFKRGKEEAPFASAERVRMRLEDMGSHQMGWMMKKAKGKMQNKVTAIISTYFTLLLLLYFYYSSTGAKVATYLLLCKLQHRWKSDYGNIRVK